jgi:YggT family protein
MDYAARAIYSGMTLYMMLVILRWLGPWLGVETDFGPWRWVARVTDPLVGRIRRLLPNLGPVDFGPMAALLALWFIRTLSLNVMFGAAR